MQFENRWLGDKANNEYAVYAVDPRAGNDAALLAVFNNQFSAERLRDFLAWAYDKYLHEAPMEPTIAP